MSRSNRPASSAWVTAERLFYPLSGVLIFGITLYGFRDFFFHGNAYPSRPLTPPIRTLLIVHGIGQLLWVLLIIAQPTLVALRKAKLHMTIGMFGAALAALLVVLGYATGIRAAQVNPPDLELFGMLPPQFLYVPLTAITGFGIGVGIAVWKRKTPAIHRAAMILGTVSALSAAMGRIDWMNNTFGGTVWDRMFGPPHSAVSLAIVLLIARCVVIRGFDKPLAIGVGALAVFQAVMLQVSKTGVWDSFAHMLIG